MLTEKDYCDYDTCVALKELGYNRGAYAYYFPNHKEDLIFNTHQMRGCSINEMLKGYNTYPKDVMGCEFIDAPTISQVLKWLRDEKKIHIQIVVWEKGWYYEVWEFGDEPVFKIQSEDFKTYEEAALAGIKYCLDNLI